MTFEKAKRKWPLCPDYEDVEEQRAMRNAFGIRVASKNICSDCTRKRICPMGMGAGDKSVMMVRNDEAIVACNFYEKMYDDKE